jgi:transposase
VVAKYSDHLPLYRQSAILERETGIKIGRATLDGWVMRVGELLTPIAAVIGRELVAGSYIQADETPVDVQMHDGRGQNHQAYLWQYGRPGGSVVFDFRLGRGREGPKKFLGQFEGILQTDGYAAYEQVGGPKMVHAACWAHARRKFFEALKLNPGDRAAMHIVARIDELFSIDAQARAENFDYAARHALRLEQARPLLDLIQQKIEMARTEALPASALGKAAHYTLALWRKLTRFLEHPELELSNNLVWCPTNNWTYNPGVPDNEVCPVRRRRLRFRRISKIRSGSGWQRWAHRNRSRCGATLCWPWPVGNRKRLLHPHCRSIARQSACGESVSRQRG